jgi:hypothetical protein
LLGVLGERRASLYGNIDKLTIAVAPPVLTAGDRTTLEAAYKAAQDAN